MEQEEFLFDDFFVSQDPKTAGTPMEIELTDVNGNARKVTLMLKRGLSFGDQQAAKENSVKKRIKPDGKVEILDVNEDVFAIELVSRSIKAWPFKYASGESVPVTRENVKLMLADGVQSLASRLIDRIGKGQQTKKAFTTPSEKN